MGKRQTRKSISVKGLTYQRMKDYCKAQGKSVSGALEEIIHEKLDAVGVPRIEPPPSEKKKPDEEIISSHFTF